ncbi:multicopy suppressor of sta proteins [Kluyveromyces marxianus]|nr:multicopy suppressor of sta proteins [Kluyveromyces marxianus]
MAGPGVNRKGNSSNSPLDKNLNSDVNHTLKNNQFNNGDASEPFVSDAMAKNSKQLLYAHIYNYLIHNQHFDSAKKFLQEANLPLSKDIPRNSLNGDKLLNSKMLMNSPDTFLLEWWQSLWALNEYVETTPTEQLMSLRPFNDRIVPILPQAPLQEMVGRMGVRPGPNTRNMAPSNIAQQQPMRHMQSPGSAPTPYSANMNSFPIAPVTNSFQTIPGSAPPQSDANIMQSPNFYQNLDGLNNGNASFRNTGSLSVPKGRQGKKLSANNKGIDQASDKDLKSTSKSKQPKSSKAIGNSNAPSKVVKPSPPVSQQQQRAYENIMKSQQYEESLMKDQPL